MSQLQSSIVLVLLSLIPNNILRYTGLGIGAVITAVYIMHMKRPSTLLRQLEDTIQETEKLIHSAKLQCARDQCDLAVEDARLLQIKVSVLEIERRILESEHPTPARPAPVSIFASTRGGEGEDTRGWVGVWRLDAAGLLAPTWKEYRLLSQRIFECKEGVRKICIAVQLIVVAERGRKHTEDIHEIQTILTSIRGSSHGAWNHRFNNHLSPEPA
ncbi:hypothetical protein B0H10DRAFT_2214266 [Mycena sp. CBHHK59/15]|nr:hypothetical protein B0H10DRAFT_2214266 [Mycena sp. CBHHK59/15]